MNNDDVANIANHIDLSYLGSAMKKNPIPRKTHYVHLVHDIAAYSFVSPPSIKSYPSPGGCPKFGAVCFVCLARAREHSQASHDAGLYGIRANILGSA